MNLPLNKICCADCFDFLASLPDECVDLVLTDPPYGTTAAPWDKRVSEDYLFAELWRVAKETAPIVMFSAQPVASELVMMQKRFFRYDWIWEKTMAVGFLNSAKMPLRAHEHILVFYRRAPRFNAIPLASQAGEPYTTSRRGHGSQLYRARQYEGGTTSENGERRPRSVVRYSQDRIDCHHGTPKPVDLLAMLIRQYTRYGDVVLDPFMGTGSTACAARQLGRNFLGCEKEKDFAKFANERLATVPTPLFDPDPTMSVMP